MVDMYHKFLGFTGLGIMLTLLGWGLVRLARMAGWFGLKKRPTVSRSKPATDPPGARRQKPTPSVSKKSYYTSKRMWGR